MATTINFPTQLPKPSARYSTRKNPGVRSTQFESGRVRQRNPFGDFRRVVDLEFEMSQRELDLFSAWFYHTLNNGASSFNLDILLDADGLQSYEVLPLEGRFNAQHFGVGNFRVSFPVLVRETKYLSEESVDLLLAYGGESIEIVLADWDAFDTLVNVTIPANF